jgi:energy-converting hydrogenase Eha subunit H
MVIKTSEMRIEKKSNKKREVMEMKNPNALSMKRLLKLVVTIPEMGRTVYEKFQYILVNVLSIALMAILA